MLTEKRVAILVADGFEQVEITEPRTALDEAGACTQNHTLTRARPTSKIS